MKILIIDQIIDLNKINLSEFSKIIVLDYNMQSILKKKQIKFDNEIKYFNDLGHIDILKTTKPTIDLLISNFNYKDHKGIKNAYKYSLLYYLRFYLNYLVKILFIIDEIIINNNPNEIYLCDQNHLDRGQVLLREDNSYFYNLLDDYIKENKKKTKLLKINNHKNIYKSKTENTFKIFVLKFLINSASLLWIQLYKFLNIKIILVNNDQYNMPSFINSLIKKNKDFKPLYLHSTSGFMYSNLLNFLFGKILFIRKHFKSYNNSNFNNYYKSFLQQISKNIKLKNYTYKKVYLFKYLNSYLTNNLFFELSNLESFSIFYYNLIKKVEPSFIFSEQSNLDAYILGEISKIMHVKAMVISHGSHVKHTNEYSSLEWKYHKHALIGNDYPYVASQTPYFHEFVKNQINNTSKIIKTGPLIFDSYKLTKNKYNELRSKYFSNHNDKYVLLHASTPKFKSGYRPYVYETVDEYIDNLNQIIKAIDKLKKIYLVIKFRERFGFKLETLRSLLIKSDNYGIYTEGVFSEYIQCCDCLISYSSTAIEQALLFNKPVILFGNDGRYFHIKEESENSLKTLYCSKNEDNLLKNIIYLKNNKNILLKKNNLWDIHKFPSDIDFSWFKEIKN